jgi:hypothetical protein
MSKTKPEIAKALLERRNRMTHVILPGEITAEIGPDGVAEALKERWLVPDLDEGFLCVSKDLGVIDEMRRLAEMKPEEYKVEAIPVAESHGLSLLHTKRGHQLHEIAAPMTGAPSPGLASTGQPAPAAAVGSVPPMGAQQSPYVVGSPVTVARQGKSSNGVIEKLLPDGRFQVGFADGQPQQGNNVFSKEEVNLVPTSPQRPPGAAAAPVGAAAS